MSCEYCYGDEWLIMRCSSRRGICCFCQLWKERNDWGREEKGRKQVTASRTNQFLTLTGIWAISLIRVLQKLRHPSSTSQCLSFSTSLSMSHTSQKSPCCQSHTVVAPMECSPVATSMRNHSSLGAMSQATVKPCPFTPTWLHIESTIMLP